MLTFSQAKINLGLHVMGKRSDGYHNIDTIFYPIPWQESVEAIKSSASSFQYYSSFSLPATFGKNNLCQQAYQGLRDHYDLSPVQLHLLKTIPVGAGLGGGSANATATLTLCNQLFDLNLSQSDLEYWAQQLGSDCPFFLYNTPHRATGRGEKLEKVHLDLSDYKIAIAVPSLSIPTAWAYKKVTPSAPSHSLKVLIQEPVAQWSSILNNAFESVVFEAYPFLAKIKEEMYKKGAIYASLSGSGSAIFGIFDKAAALTALPKQLNIAEKRFFTCHPNPPTI